MGGGVLVCSLIRISATRSSYLATLMAAYGLNLRTRMRISSLRRVVVQLQAKAGAGSRRMAGNQLVKRFQLRTIRSVVRWA